MQKPVSHMSRPELEKLIEQLKFKLALSQKSDEEARALNQKYFEKIKRLESTILGITK